MDELLKKLRRDYPNIQFTPGDLFYWSPKNTEIIFNKAGGASREAAWSLLHEVGHATLEHKDYKSDIELLQLEVAAWEQAKTIGIIYGYEIDIDHIEDCLDSYRDWLHRRSACPTCENRSLQQTSSKYSCFNCGTTWAVSKSRFCRPYRMLAKTK